MLTLREPNRTQDRVIHSQVHELLATDLNFHDQNSSSLSHDLHAFPAKFPPQLPRLFIETLTRPGERVLDPMMGSGTCIVEARDVGRVGIGFDIDPLAILLSSVKVSSLDAAEALAMGLGVLDRAEEALRKRPVTVAREFAKRFDPATRSFVAYWFAPETQLELHALSREIDCVSDQKIRDFLRLVFSSIIITKSGGVSLAWDLAHTRPHKSKQGLLKSYKPTNREFHKRLLRNVRRLQEMPRRDEPSFVQYANAEAMPLETGSVDMVFTSPPYASNAIDYMRAHKFSLIWFGYSVAELTERRAQYIGGEKVSNFAFQPLTPKTEEIVQRVAGEDFKKGQTLHRYFSEMSRVLREIYRVLKPGRVSALVVGSSTMRGIDTQTHLCLGEIGEAVGLELVGIATRQLDRDRRMMPARSHAPRASMIEQRMHEEYVIVWTKPS